MDSGKKQGILFILVGMAIPLIILPFVSGLSVDKGLRDMFFNAGIVIRKDAQKTPAVSGTTESVQTGEESRRTYSSLIPRRIPYRYFFIPMVIFIYIGIVKIDRSRRKERED